MRARQAPDALENDSSPLRGGLARLFNPLGAAGLTWLNHYGAATLFFLRALRMIFGRHQLKSIFEQLYFIGARTMGIIVLVALFTGMVIGLQLYYTLVKFGSEGALGSAIGLSLVRELGPVLSAIMITARAGSAMTAEIGIQRISEQIDALYTMGIDSLAYLVSPRVAAALISFPLLTALFDMVGIAGGYLSGVILAGTDTGVYFYRLQESVAWIDVLGGFIKAVVFAALVVTVCCYHGYYTHRRKSGRGARGVSLSTTAAV
ncbi:MAG: ABC transporter permease, partial [Desulfobacterales bacterium]